VVERIEKYTSALSNYGNEADGEVVIVCPYQL
jgi:hypothetical protein